MSKTNSERLTKLKPLGCSDDQNRLKRAEPLTSAEIWRNNYDVLDALAVTCPLDTSM